MTPVPTSALSSSLFALFASGWHPNTAVWETSKEYDPAPTHGAYFFGIEVRELAAHFAVASMAEEESTPEVYFVSAKGWHRLDLEIWNNDLLPMVGRMMSAGRLNDEINSMERAIAYLIAQSGDVEEEALIGGELKPLNETARNTVRRSVAICCWNARWCSMRPMRRAAGLSRRQPPPHGMKDLKLASAGG